MTRKLAFLLAVFFLSFTLFATSATVTAAAEAEAAAEATSTDYASPLEPFAPTTEDFLGEWTLLYVIDDGEISPEAAQHTADALVISEEGMCSRLGLEQSPLYPYEISGKTLKADGTVCTLAAPDLLLVAAENPGTLVYHRTLLLGNPFIGDWRVILTTSDGILDCRGMENVPEFRFSHYTVTLRIGPYEESLSCSYKNGVCIVEQDGASFTFSIDANGLMTMDTEAYGVNALLLRVQ